MSFLRQLFGITTRRGSTVRKLTRPTRKTLVTTTNYEYAKGKDEDNFFDYIIGYNDIKKFLRMSINAEEPNTHTFDWTTSFSKDNVYQVNDDET